MGGQEEESIIAEKGRNAIKVSEKKEERDGMIDRMRMDAKKEGNEERQAKI